MKTNVFFDRVKAVENEYRIAARAVAELFEDVAHGAGALADLGLTPADQVNCQRQLEGTYIIRLFAEFEMALRQFWQAKRKLKQMPRTPAEVLIDSVAARCNVAPPGRIRRAHDVREYRNSLVHEGAPKQILSLSDCRSFLCTYLSYLAHEW